MSTSSPAEEKSSPSPSIICSNPSWEIVKSMAYLPNSISHRQVLISYLDPFPSRADDKSTNCDYLAIFFFFFTFLHDLTPDNGGWGGVGGYRRVCVFKYRRSKKRNSFLGRKKKVISVDYSRQMDRRLKKGR